MNEKEYTYKNPNFGDVLVTEPSFLGNFILIPSFVILICNKIMIKHDKCTQ